MSANHEKKIFFTSQIKPMLAKTVEQPFNNINWIFETKYDGYRIMAHKYGGNLTLYSRSLFDYTDKFKIVAQELKKIKHDFISDGEIVAYNQEKVDFASLQKLQNHTKIEYFVFDLMFFNGKDLRNIPLIERKKIILKNFKNSNNIKIVKFTDTFGVKKFRHATAKGHEGIIAKKKDSFYESGLRSKNWLKIKTKKNREFFIGGYLTHEQKTSLFALLLGDLQDNKLQFFGKVGIGFSETVLKKILSRLQKIKINQNPFIDLPQKYLQTTVFVRPIIKAKVEYTEITEQNRLRHPVFKELVKPIMDISDNTLVNGKKNVSLYFTNIEKIFWPKKKYAKKDLLYYYKEISSIILPYLIDRPLTLLRHPNGIAEQSFFQKNIDIKETPKFVEAVKIFSESKKENITYMLCNNLQTLLYIAQLGSIEINIWNSQYYSADYPDYMVFDIDPGEKNTWKQVRTVALKTYRMLKISGLTSFVKTSGKKGMHIYVPLNKKYSTENIRMFAGFIMRVVNDQLMQFTTLERTVSLRKNKIYLDFLQNRFGQTMVAPYSVRANPHANVSTPILWEELEQNIVDPKNYDIKNIFKRIEKLGDVWKDFFTIQNDLPTAINRLKKYFSD